MKNKPFYPTDREDVYFLAPIPVFKKEYGNDIITQRVFDLGNRLLDPEGKLQGQELPFQYDKVRQDHYYLNYDYQEEWTESHELPPLGSRYYAKPNDFLSTENEDVEVIKRRIINGFKSLVGDKDCKPVITENWMQYYHPADGRGHNAHNHNRWQHSEEKPKMYSGGYYLNDGKPHPDHPYSGAFSFHVRGAKYFIRPKAGMLLIWPHDIIHSVEPFYGKKHRAVINFNIEA